MKDIAFHISDIAENSIGAGATCIEIEIDQSREPLFTFTIKDNGCGMDQSTVNELSNPFYTTRTTRKVGLGIPFLVQNCEQTGGDVKITSEKGIGTVLKATLNLSHIDAPPKGTIASTLALLMTGNPEIEFCINIRLQNETFSLNSTEIKTVLVDIPISFPQVTLFLESEFRRYI